MDDTLLVQGSPTKNDGIDSAHDRLKGNPVLWGTVGVTQTLLTSGVIFGWASLLPVIRASGVDYTPEQFSLIFTAGAVGNYTSTLIFGMILDNFGPKITSIIASVFFAFGLILCAAVHNYFCFAVGFAIVGFAGPGIQMPTLHLANLFPSKAGGTGAFYMSAQAAAFDGGTAVFAIGRLMHQLTGFSASSFFLIYALVPACCIITAIVAWPNEILESPSDIERLRENGENEEYMGVGSPYLSPKGRLGIRSRKNGPRSLIDAPISVVLKHSTFWSMAIWAGIHILKLNFVVATINDQLDKNVATEVANHLIDILGAMLPFGFVALPVVAATLDREPIWAFELANIIGILYGGILAFFPVSEWMQCFVVFPSVACSRQLVYSTLFHQLGANFGFTNYGVLLGLINVMVSLFSAIQTPLVAMSERQRSYYWANLLLWAATFPLFITALLTKPDEAPIKIKARKEGYKGITNEKSRLLTETKFLSRDGKSYRVSGSLEL